MNEVNLWNESHLQNLPTSPLDNSVWNEKNAGSQSQSKFQTFGSRSITSGMLRFHDSGKKNLAGERDSKISHHELT